MATSRPLFSQGDSWLADYESAEALGDEIMQTIATRNQQQKHSVGYSQSNVKARQLITKFSEGREKLVEKLLASQPSLLEGEFERRERMLDRLWTKKLRIEAAFSERNESAKRSELFGDGGGGATSMNLWGVEETDETRDLSFDELKQHQQYAIQEQDKNLSTLHDVVVRQKRMAENIGQELDLHNEIIEDLTDHTDRTRERLIKETRHVTIVDRKSNTCGYWVVIILLMIAIIAVACVPKK